MSTLGSDDMADCIPPTTSGKTSGMSASTSASTSTHEVRITLSLSMSQSAFTKDKQAAFKASLAQAAGVAGEAVVINKIESTSSRRHLLAEAIRVETSIMAAGEAAAQEMAGRLTADSINRELSKAGLPTATVLEAATASNTGTVAVAAATAEASSSSFFSTPVLVGGILGIMFLAGIVACVCRWKCKNDVVLSQDTQIPVTLEMGTLATSVNESPVYDALGVSSAPRLKKVQGSGKLREPLAQDAGPGQVQTNQARDREAEAVVPHIQYSELAVESNALAAGSFKSVYKARWEKKGRNVALLVLRHSNQAALSDMDNEIRMFGTLGKHKHLAQLLATCTQAQSEEKCMVMEFAPLGSLDHVLSKVDEDGVDISNLVKITLGMQVAEAMTHLHNYNVVHRDLATRNTLVFRFDPQNWKLVLVKVTDYGLSLLAHKGFTEGASVIEVATMSSNAAGPTRWMAPESIMRRVYSKKSDVWSFGVVLYEVWTLGMIPYHLIADDKEVARQVTQGERLSQPGNCPQQVYAIMQDCWKSAQKDRPSMPQLQTALQEVFTKESLGEAKSECVVCLSAEPVMALMPCGHRCACADCAPSLRMCPICRCPVQEAKRIFG
jgi:tRNA A-37 threonylcarbamoyl transferase component Bud32